MSFSVPPRHTLLHGSGPYALVGQGQAGEVIMRHKDGKLQNIFFPAQTGFGTHREIYELAKKVVDFLNSQES